MKSILMPLTAITVLALSTVPALTTANIIQVFPARAAFTLEDAGDMWIIDYKINVINNNSFDQDVSFEVINIGNATYKNKVNIYNGTIYNMHDEYDPSYMRLFTDIPNTSWVTVPAIITCQRRDEVKDIPTIIEVPVEVRIPKSTKYDDNFYQCYIEVKPVQNGSIQTSLSSKLLLQTPALYDDSYGAGHYFAIIATAVTCVALCGLIYFFAGRKHE